MTSLLQKQRDSSYGGGGAAAAAGGGGGDYGSIHVGDLDPNNNGSTNFINNNDDDHSSYSSLINNNNNTRRRYSSSHGMILLNDSITSLSELPRSLSHLSGSIRESLRDSLLNVSGGGSKCSVRDLQGQSTIFKSSFNLIKNLVGAGVLALPSGV